MGHHSTRDRAIELLTDIDSYMIAPPKRGGSDERVSGTVDPRRLPASETLLQIAIDFGRFCDLLAAGRGADLLSDPSIPLPAWGALQLIPALRDRRVVVTSVRDGVAHSSVVRVVRLAAIEDRGDVSDEYVSSILVGFELRLADWVRGHDPEDDEESSSPVTV